MTRADRRTRIAFCHHTADVQGGSDRSLLDLVTHLSTERYVPAMILRPGDPLGARYRAAGIPVYEVPFVPPRRALEPLTLARFAAGLWPGIRGVVRAVRAHEADVVHVNTLNNVHGALGAKVARRPLVWHVRELGKGALVDRLLLGLAARLANRAVAISRAVAATLAACGPRLRLVTNGIDLSEFQALPARTDARRACGIPDAARVIAVIGRLEPSKGQDVALAALASLSRRLADAVLLVVGGGATTKPDFGPALVARAAALGLGERVRFLGLRRDVPQILAATDVLIAPGVSPEPFGRTLVEAMAAGVPVIATAEGGPLEIVTHFESGLLVPPRSADALAEAIGAVLDDPALALRLADAGRRRVAERYALPRVVREMSEVFDDLVPDRPLTVPGVAAVSPT